MPFEVILDEVPSGIARKAARKGDSVTVYTSGFISSEDGQEFITYLEQLPSILLVRAVGDRVSPSQVANLLAIIHADKTATVYVNELHPSIKTKVGRNVERGDPVLKDDIVDITRADLGVDVPRDAAVVFVFSWGWRKGFFFDFGPVGPDAEPRTFDLPEVIGQLYARLLFQERFSINDSEWTKLFEAAWFPFAGLSNDTIGSILTHVREDWDPDELTPRVVEELRERIPSFLASWISHPSLATHSFVLERAVNSFLSGDHLGCSTLLFPCIKDILQSNPSLLGKDKPASVLMPHRFGDFLREVFFPRFDPVLLQQGDSTPETDAGTGGKKVSERKDSAISLLVVNQIFHSFEPRSKQEEKVSPANDTVLDSLKVSLGPVEAANRWRQWHIDGSDEVLGQLVERLDAILPTEWKRLDGEDLKPFDLLVAPGSALYSLATTAQYVGVILSIERPAAEFMRGGRVWFAGPPIPPTATIPAAWDQVMRLLDEGIVRAADEVGAEISAPGPDALFLAELPSEIGSLLVSFSRSAAKSFPLSYKESQRWNTFVISTFRMRAAVDTGRLAGWFMKEGWEHDEAKALTARFMEECLLLSCYADEVLAQ